MKKKFESNFKYKETAIYYCQQCLQPCEEEYDRVHAARNQRTILNITDETGTVADMWNNLQSFESTQFTERQCENNCGNIFHGTKEFSGQPAMLFLQINRFTFANNRIIKIKTPIQLTEKFTPFPGGAQYHLHSVTYHNGNTAQSGHYTTLLHFKDNEKILVSDDHRQPIPAKGVPGEPYFLTYVRDDLPLQESPVKKKVKLTTESINGPQGDLSHLPEVLKKILRGDKIPRLNSMDKKDVKFLYDNLLNWSSFSVADVSAATLKELQACVNNMLVELFFTVWPENHKNVKWLMSTMQLDTKLYNKVVLGEDWSSQEGKLPPCSTPLVLSIPFNLSCNLELSTFPFLLLKINLI